MRIDDRDRDVFNLVARFKQLSTAQVNELAFHGVASRSPSDRTLRRLVERGLLARVERRLVGGSGGGSGLYCYQLGRAGHAVMREGRYMPWRTVNYHALAIADTYIQLVRLERAGKLNINGYSNEPDCWLTIGKHELKPDMFVDLALPSGATVKLWLEVDMGSEGQRQIKSKLARYRYAYSEADAAEWPEFPSILWVAIDEPRMRELQWIISQEPKDSQALFRVMTLDEFAASFS